MPRPHRNQSLPPPPLLRFPLPPSRPRCPTSTPFSPFPSSSPGAYTTARTVGVTRVFKLGAHVTRLATSANLMAAADRQVRPADHHLPPLLLSTVDSCLPGSICVHGVQTPGVQHVTVSCCTHKLGTVFLCPPCIHVRAHPNPQPHSTPTTPQHTLHPLPPPPSPQASDHLAPDVPLFSADQLRPLVLRSMAAAVAAFEAVAVGGSQHEVWRAGGRVGGWVGGWVGWVGEWVGGTVCA
jgi:hypothetical protein